MSGNYEPQDTKYQNTRREECLVTSANLKG